MKVLMLWSYYPVYLQYFYSKYRDIKNESFCRHREYIVNDHFGWPSDLSEYLNRVGINAEFIIKNDKELQLKWAKEEGFSQFSDSDWEEKIAAKQIKKHKPDILLIPNPGNETSKILNDTKNYYKKLCFYLGHGMIGKKLEHAADLLISVERQLILKDRPSCDKLITIRTGFNREILKKINIDKSNDSIVFIGSVTPEHTERANILAYLIKKGINIKVYGVLSEINKSIYLKSIYGDFIKRLAVKKGINKVKFMLDLEKFNENINIIKKVYRGPIFGLDYYRMLANSKISLNIHIDLAKNFAGNMRMFETTGVGTCLVTDKKTNVGSLFETGKEILTFSSKDELCGILSDIQTDTKIDKVATAGQLKTLGEYNMEKFTAEIKKNMLRILK